jgi:hypothetical protein
MYNARLVMSRVPVKLFLFFLLFLASRSHAQLSFGIENSFYHSSFFIPFDTVKKDSLPQPKVHSPKTAVIMSACLPGLGQVYNKKYWKVPIIYVGLGALAYGFIWNEDSVLRYHRILIYRYDSDPNTIDPYPNVSDDDIVTQKNYYRKYRDMCVIGGLALYTLQIIDAAVDAHLWKFDEKIGDDLSMNFQPYITPVPGYQSVGMTVSLHFH